jgi:nanoRNase/pAp phosphatase (c-di-AMP/oligoRNAs hydrolase)
VARLRELKEFLLETCKKKQQILVLCHHDADVDAVASALVLAECLTQLGAKATAGTSEGLNQAAQRLLKLTGREIQVNPPLKADLVILVDTSSLEHLGKLGEPLKNSGIPITIIDHHLPVERTKQLAKFYWVKDDVPSESELIANLIVELGMKPTPSQALLLLVGIMADTGHFRLAKSSTFEVVNQLIKAGADYWQALNVLKEPENFSKRVAMLKAAQRSELYRMYEHLVTFSELSSFEGDAAGMFLKFGADVALVGSGKKGEVRISGRAREGLCAAGLHLGELMARVGEELSGFGGGHAGAASLTGNEELPKAKKLLLDELRKFFKNKTSG